MPRFAANLTMLFTEVPFPERFAAARQAGFRHVEFLHPYEYSPDQVREMAVSNGLQVVLFNVPSGAWAEGDRGIAAHPGRVEEFRAGVKRAIPYALALGAPRLNCLAGKACADFTREEHWVTLVENVRFAADVLGEHGLNLMVEPINHYDMPGFVLNTTKQGLDLLAQVGRSNVYLQYDIYHAQREEGNITPTLREHISKIGHIQIADNPGRHQPGTGELNFPFLFAELDRLGYAGFVSAEYIPSPNTLASLDWIRAQGGIEG